MLKKFGLAVSAILMAFTLMFATSTAAGAAFFQTEPATSQVAPANLKVKYAEQTAWNRLYIEFNNGAAGVFTNCATDDSQWDCFWNATQFGNGGGNNFIRLNGRDLSVPRGNCMYLQTGTCKY